MGVDAKIKHAKPLQQNKLSELMRIHDTPAETQTNTGLLTPHIQIRKDISKFSPPHTSMPMSYVPSS